MHRGLAKGTDIRLPYRIVTRLRRSSTEREVEDIRESSELTPGLISTSRNRCSAKGSTLRRWIAVTTPQR
jgi:hypothetical protein